ncbi:uncharacterized protein LOC141905214 [Tubulanus polymorphus]|uniref:uncharacterized protein LOC141905214 n=1 Tax=Tubulanus polymorphus TaxID=672921 RepID=UPI003DA22825
MDTISEHCDKPKKIKKKKRHSVAEPGTCLFCGTSSKDENFYGKLFSLNGISVHYFCMLFSSGLCQNGGSEKDGILGFLTIDIKKEYRRGKRLKCGYCKNKGATIGCCMKACRMMFHFDCGRKNGALHQFFGTYSSYCHSHRLKQQIPPDRTYSDPCPICMTPVETVPSLQSLKPQCCRKTWFHRSCIEKFAVSAGLYFFKCPMCNNKDEFQSEMLKFGIYIPDQDATWEREPNAFVDLIERYNHCDSTECFCPKGRDFNKDDTKWEIVLCDLCGSSGTHLKCQKLKSHMDNWSCTTCKNTDAAAKSCASKPNKTENEYTKILKKKAESEYPSSSKSKLLLTVKDKPKKRKHSATHITVKRRKTAATSTVTLTQCANSEIDNSNTSALPATEKSLSGKEKMKKQGSNRFWTYIPTPPPPEHSPSKVSPSKILNKRLRSQRSSNDQGQLTTAHDSESSDSDSSQLISSNSAKKSLMTEASVVSYHPIVSLPTFSDNQSAKFEPTCTGFDTKSSHAKEMMKQPKNKKLRKNTARKSMQRSASSNYKLLNQVNSTTWKVTPDFSPNSHEVAAPVSITVDSDSDDDIKITSVKLNSYKCVCHAVKPRRFVPRNPGIIVDLTLNSDTDTENTTSIESFTSDKHDPNCKTGVRLNDEIPAHSLYVDRDSANMRKLLIADSCVANKTTEYCDLNDLVKLGCPQIVAPSSVISVEYEGIKSASKSPKMYHNCNSNQSPRGIKLFSPTQVAKIYGEIKRTGNCDANLRSPNSLALLMGHSQPSAHTTDNRSSGKPVGVVQPLDFV